MGKKKNNVKCRALILLDTGEIRKKYLAHFQSRKKTLEKLEKELGESGEIDEAEYRKFLASRLGAEQSQLRELEQALQLSKSRLDKIQFLSYARGISTGQYCRRLRRKVTPEQDFWFFLEKDLMDWQEEETKRRQEEARREEEERQARRERKAGRENKPEEEWGEQDFKDALDDIMDEMFSGIDDDDDHDDDYDDYDVNDDDDFTGFKEDFDQWFDGLFGNHAGKPEMKRNDERELKKLYRELCLRYHPDRAGRHDARMKRLWNEIQNAYQERNLDRLRFFCNQEKVFGGNRDLCCSEIEALTRELENRIRHLRSELRELRKLPHYRFSMMNEKKRQNLEKKLRSELTVSIRLAGQELQDVEKILNRLLHGGKSGVKPKKGRPQQQDRKRPRFPEQDDLFGDIPF